MVECYIDVDVGTLYYAVRQLEKDGLITAVAEERVARGGMRTIYRITDEGRHRVPRWACTNSSRWKDRSRRRSMAALLFLHLADRGPRSKTRSGAGSTGSTISSPSSSPIREDLAPVISTGGEHLLRHIERATEARPRLAEGPARRYRGERNSGCCGPRCARSETRLVDLLDPPVGIRRDAPLDIDQR